MFFSLEEETAQLKIVYTEASRDVTRRVLSDQSVQVEAL